MSLKKKNGKIPFGEGKLISSRIWITTGSSLRELDLLRIQYYSCMVLYNTTSALPVSGSVMN